MRLRENEVLARDGSGRLRRAPRPSWANDPNMVLSPEDTEAFQNASLGMWPRHHWSGEKVEADIVLRGEGDLIFHFHGIRLSDFRELLAETVEDHFGTTDFFRFDDIPELPQTYGLLAKGVRTFPLFNMNHYVGDFLQLLDAVLVEAGN